MKLKCPRNGKVGRYASRPFMPAVPAGGFADGSCTYGKPGYACDESGTKRSGRVSNDYHYQCMPYDQHITIAVRHGITL